ncbi:hypothetical protein BU16DRAFT_568052 [Lophium mytilinum]|uniref:Uncharacterized protein n=1 Tax=Lophium mytilinum TaxID=390894 RepID=A0A6A6Q8W3_9PEZI|nr:hypothetical protein BU16DRAFT_568052 [Lophium mytilinum]
MDQRPISNRTHSSLPEEQPPSECAERIAANKGKLGEALLAIALKYQNDPTISDKINLQTWDIVENNGHLENLPRDRLWRQTWTYARGSSQEQTSKAERHNNGFAKGSSEEQAFEAEKDDSNNAGGPSQEQTFKAQRHDDSFTEGSSEEQAFEAEKDDESDAEGSSQKRAFKAKRDNAKDADNATGYEAAAKMLQNSIACQVTAFLETWKEVPPHLMGFLITSSPSADMTPTFVPSSSSSSIEKAVSNAAPVPIDRPTTSTSDSQQVVLSAPPANTQSVGTTRLH